MKRSIIHPSLLFMAMPSLFLTRSKGMDLSKITYTVIRFIQPNQKRLVQNETPMKAITDANVSTDMGFEIFPNPSKGIFHVAFYKRTFTK